MGINWLIYLHVELLLDREVGHLAYVRHDHEGVRLEGADGTNIWKSVLDVYREKLHTEH